MVSLTENACVVPRRPGRTKGIARLALHDGVYGLDCGTCRDECCFPGFLGGDSVLVVEIADHFISGAFELSNVLNDLLDVIKIVDLENVSDFCTLTHVVF